MTKKLNAFQAGNWLLIAVSSILLLIGAALTAFAFIYMTEFGWWSLAIAMTGLTTIGASVFAIIENDPTWILLNLILP